MDMFVVKSELGYARFMEGNQVQWVPLAKASVYGKEGQCRELMEKVKGLAPSVRMAKLHIKEEDWI